jgi:hypothetical protein
MNAPSYSMVLLVMERYNSSEKVRLLAELSKFVGGSGVSFFSDSVIFMNAMTIERNQFVEELIEYFLSQKYVVHGALGTQGYEPPPAIRNDGFGDLHARVPDVIGLDREKKRIVFGIVRENREELDAEKSLTDYNVYLDHNHAAGDNASQLVVLLPSSLITDFNTILTHYIHREYWHRVTTVTSRRER